jgi:hypothetical protein
MIRQLLLTCLEEGQKTTTHLDGPLGMSVVGHVALEEAAPQHPTFYFDSDIDLLTEALALLQAAGESDGIFANQLIGMLRKFDRVFRAATLAQDCQELPACPVHTDSVTTFSATNTVHAGPPCQPTVTSCRPAGLV